MTSQPIQPTARAETLKISYSTTLLVWLARKLGRLVQVLVRSPAKWALTALLATACTAAWAVSTIAPTPAAAFTAMLCLMPLAPLAAYSTNTAGRLRGTLRSLLVYRRHWSKYLTDCNVITQRSQAPFLLRTNSTKTFDQLHIRMTAGQRLEDWTNNADRLAQTFGALNCRITPTSKPRWLQLMFLTTDPLTNPVDPYPPEEDTLTKGLPIAKREDGKPWRLKLLGGSHPLIAGATGAGKSGVLWTIIHTLTPHIDAQTVKLWVIDPKGGMEFASARYWFDRFIHGHQPAQYAQTLEDAVRLMQHRQEQLFGVTQQHTPSVSQPLYIIIIDELAALTAWRSDRQAQQRTRAALALLLQQGRAAGIVIIGAIQDPKKETLPSRDLFPTRIGLRLTEEDQIRMIFGTEARTQGVRCDKIDPDTKGVAYVQIEGEAGHARVRFAHITPNMLGGPKMADLPQTESEPETATLTQFGVA